MPDQRDHDAISRCIVQQQIADLMEKASARPESEDRLGMVGLMATLVAAKLQSLLLQAEQDTEQV
jgi:hypothetical protein